MINRQWIKTIVCLPPGRNLHFYSYQSSVRHQVLITRLPHFLNDNILCVGRIKKGESKLTIQPTLLWYLQTKHSWRHSFRGLRLQHNTIWHNESVHVEIEPAQFFWTSSILFFGMLNFKLSKCKIKLSFKYYLDHFSQTMIPFLNNSQLHWNWALAQW